MADLKSLLSGYDANVLKAIARENAVISKAQSKGMLVNVLATQLARREQVERALAKVRPAENEVLTRLLRVGGEAAASPLKSALEKDKVVALPPKPKNSWEDPYSHPPQGNPNYAGAPTFEDALARLTLLGLVFSREAIEPYKQVIAWDIGRHLVIPPEIRALLPTPAPEKIAPTAEPARSVASSARAFQRDLSRYWSFVKRAEKLELTSQGWVYKKALIEIVKALGWQENKKPDEKNDLYLFFLRQMLVALELVEPETATQWDNRASAFFPKEGKEFWARPPSERVKAAFDAWLGATTWNELRIPKATYGQDHRRPAPVELITARRVILDHLKRSGTSAWVNLSDLLDDIRLADYEFLFSRPKGAGYSSYAYSYASPYYHSNNRFGISYDGVKDEAEGWDQIEGAIITHIIAGPLHWLGLTDLGFDAGDTPRAYRLTAMGAWLLGLGEAVAITEEGGRVVVQPNFQIVAMEPIAENVLMTLDEFAQFEGGDHALTYRLTRESVYRGQRAAWDAARIVAYLEEATRTPLPQNVRRSLEEWQALHERITFRRGVALLQAADAATLDALFADAALAPKLGRRVSEQVALPSQPASAVEHALREQDWLPVVTRRDQTDAPASVAADEEGNAVFVHRTPSIYAYRGIEAFAELLDARRARITPERVRAAIEQHLTVPDLLTRLRGVHRGDAPPKLVQRIKAWGKYFGDARGGALTLIEFRDESARAELLADAELQPYLTRFEAGARPLALVRAGALERVQKLLAERGVEIHAFE